MKVKYQHLKLNSEIPTWCVTTNSYNGIDCFSFSLVLLADAAGCGTKRTASTSVVLIQVLWRLPFFPQRVTQATHTMATIEIIRDMVSMMMNTVTAIGPARVLPTGGKGGKGGNGGNAVKQKQKKSKFKLLSSLCVSITQFYKLHYSYFIVLIRQ